MRTGCRRAAGRGEARVPYGRDQDLHRLTDFFSNRINVCDLPSRYEEVREYCKGS